MNYEKLKDSHIKIIFLFTFLFKITGCRGDGEQIVTPLNCGCGF